MNFVLAEFKSITTECQQNANDSGTGEEENPCHGREENERSEDEGGPRSNFQCHGARGMLPHGTVTGRKRGTDTGVVCLVDLE